MLCLVWLRERGYGESLVGVVVLVVLLYPAVQMALGLLVSTELVQYVLVSFALAGPMAMSVLAIRYVARA